ncbi:hypothetical protein JG687_00016174 [Phytophthora cactorum]|uniref:Uncharacterized protein n=1 Tax=Phytophthora cactorum TaxID=29920 RepID=A0A8T1TSX6_9STRA|nr:hypothetical protein JG687_00016174 [Phytophthora cactorum]
MAEAPPGQKRKRDEPSGTRKRRSVRSSVEGVSAETASSLGSVAVFTDAWGSLWVCAWVELLQNKGPRQEASMTLQIRPSSLSATSKEPVTKKRQSLLVQQLSPGVKREEVVEDAQLDEPRAQKVCDMRLGKRLAMRCLAL